MKTRLRLSNDNQLEQILTKLEVLDTRLQHVESRMEQRGFDTKPIWEQALVAIMDLRQDVASVNRKIDVFSKDMLSLRADQLKTKNESPSLRLEMKVVV